MVVLLVLNDVEADPLLMAQGSLVGTFSFVLAPGQGSYLMLMRLYGLNADFDSGARGVRGGGQGVTDPH